jgi:hypothetical protein
MARLCRTTAALHAKSYTAQLQQRLTDDHPGQALALVVACGGWHSILLACERVGDCVDLLVGSVDRACTRDQHTQLVSTALHHSAEQHKAARMLTGFHWHNTQMDQATIS